MPTDILLRIAADKMLSAEKRLAAYQSYEDMMWAGAIDRGLRFRDVPDERKDSVYAVLCAILGDKRVEFSAAGHLKS